MMFNGVRMLTVGMMLSGASWGTCLAQPAADWQKLFNGEDLSGWKANLHPDSYEVVEGVLRVHDTSAQESSHLFFVGEDPEQPKRFKNFELKLKVRGEPNSNSGVYIHSDMQTRDQRMHLQNGYEIQLNSTAKEKRKTGSLYGIVDLAVSPVDETQWFDVRIQVEGKRIQVWVNDQQTVDYTEQSGDSRPVKRTSMYLRDEGGLIALQAHDIGSMFYFKDIFIRPRPD